MHILLGLTVWVSGLATMWLLGAAVGLWARR